MEETIKMKAKNADGVLIIKEIPKSLYSAYKNIGWEEHKEIKEDKNLSKLISKEKKEINENL